MGYEDDRYNVEDEDGNDKQHIRFPQWQRHTFVRVRGHHIIQDYAVGHVLLKGK